MLVTQSTVPTIVCISIVAIFASIGAMESQYLEDEIESLKAKPSDENDEFIKRAYQLLQYNEKPKYRFTGSVYYRWGSSECGSNSELIYEGIVGGGFYKHAGSGVNALCLPRDPDLDESPPSRPRKYYGYIYGAEYKMGPNEKHDVPCAVCSTPNRLKNIMIPAKRTCPKYWKNEYTGWLAAGYYAHASASEFVCIDGGFETDAGGYKAENGKLFYYVQTKCGSLPCPNYADGKILPCVVCSK